MGSYYCLDHGWLSLLKIQSLSMIQEDELILRVKSPNIDGGLSMTIVFE